MMVKTLCVGSFEENCYLITINDATYVIDPGAEPERIFAELERMHATPKAVLLTHAHFDHIGAIPELQRRLPELQVYVPPEDLAVLTHPMNQYPPDYPPIAKPQHVSWPPQVEGMEVIATPGHTPGGVCYYFPSEELLFSGDTVFAGAVGRTDLPGGSYERLMESLLKLKDLPGSTRVLPGHGPATKNILLD